MLPTDLAEPVRLDARRIAAVLRLRGETFSSLAHAAGVSAVHLHFVLAGKRRLSPRVGAAIKQYLGDAFAFAAGQSPTLTLQPNEEIANAGGQ